MTDYNTMAKIHLKGDIIKKIDGSVFQQLSDGKHKSRDFITLTKDCIHGDDYLNILGKLGIKESELPIIRKKYYSKEFVNKNWSIINHCLALAYNENTEEELEYLIELENYIAEEDWQLEELEDFNEYQSHFVSGNWHRFPIISTFEDYENAFVYKDVPALIFEELFVGNTPAYFFNNFKNENKPEHVVDTTCLSAIFRVNDIDNYFDKDDKYSHIYQEEIDSYKKNYSTYSNENDEYFVFAFG